jgi:hypothetical protein
LDAKIRKKDEKSYAFSAKKLQKMSTHSNKKAANQWFATFYAFQSSLSAFYSWLI